MAATSALEVTRPVPVPIPFMKTREEDEDRSAKIDGRERVESSLWVNERRMCGHQVDLGFLYTIEARVKSRKFGVLGWEMGDSDARVAVELLKRTTGEISRGYDLRNLVFILHVTL